MNIAGPLASLIFAITVLTVFGGLFAYGVYKARERTRKKPATTKKVLQYFVEYELPALPAVAAAGGLTPAMAPRVEKEGRPWGLYFVSMLAIGGMITASVYYYRSGKRIVLQGAWQQGTGPSKEFPGPPERPKVSRGPVIALDLKTRRSSLFPSARFDKNHDGLIQPDERAALHAEVPLTMLVTVDDNGHAQGLLWLYEMFEKHKLMGKVTFFLTGNYAEGKPNYLGGPVTTWWTTIARENFIGLHGLTHTDPGVEWSRQRWSEENSTAMKDITTNVAPAEGWPWNTYPWGSRATFLSFNDDYFTALDRISPVIKYDASMVVHPNAPLPGVGAPLPARDVSWPFSLDLPLPDDVELPYSGKLDRRVTIGTHAIYEVPVYSWAVREKDKLAWTPSLDVNLFKTFPCGSDGTNGEVVAAFERNLQAHYQGNRAPFHLGLHAQNYTADKKCERKTVEAILAKVDALVASGSKIQYDAAPHLLAALAAAP
jgi:hypothetical protein